MANYPDRRSAAIPALHAVQERYGWCSPEGDRAGRLRDAGDARLPDRRRDLLRHARDAARRAPPRLRLHEHLVLAVRRRRAARARCARRSATTRLQPARLRVPRRLRHRADGLGRRRLRRARSTLDEVPAAGRARCAPARSRCPTSSSSAARAPTPKVAALMSRHPAVRGHRRARPAHARRSTSAAAATRRCARRCEMPAARSLDRARGLRPARPRRRRLLDGHEGLVHPPGRDGQVPRRATPTSPSRAPSRTAS